MLNVSVTLIFPRVDYFEFGLSPFEVIFITNLRNPIKSTIIIFSVPSINLDPHQDLITCHKLLPRLLVQKIFIWRIPNQL